MRYYNIVISDTSGKEKRRFTSFVNGLSIPGALNIELDVPVVSYATPMGDAALKIWGISLQDISQASDFNNLSIKVSAGFQKGLPLANPRQAGLIVQGYIFQAFGNWIGTEQTLDFVIKAGTAPTVMNPGNPIPVRNIVLNWKSGTKLADALASSFSVAYPGFQQQIKISDRLVRQNDEPGVYSDIIPFSQYLNQVSKAIIGDSSYRGVNVVLAQNTIYVFDGSDTSLSKVTQIEFKDLIGQPTWIGPQTISIKTAMRADLKVGDVIEMPQSVVTNTAASLSSLVNQKTAFQGKFQVQQLRHLGSFRQPDAASWVTALQAFPIKDAA